MGGPREQGRSTPQQQKDDSSGERIRKPLFHVSPRSVTEPDRSAHDSDFAEKSKQLSVQEGAEVACGPSTHLMGIDLTQNSASECIEKGTNGFLGDKSGPQPNETVRRGSLETRTCAHTLVTLRRTTDIKPCTWTLKVGQLEMHVV